MESLQVNQKTGSKEQIDMVIRKLTTEITKSFDENSTTFTPSDKKKDLPRNILAEIELKKRLRSRWQKTRDPTVKTAFNR